MNQQIMINMLLNQLKSKNPAGYNQVMNYMKSGQNPESIINNMLSSGQITQEQLNSAKSYLNNTNNNSGFRKF